MRRHRVRLTIWRLMFAVAVFGIALAFLKSVVAFLDSPFLGPDPEGIRGWAPILFGLRALFCAAALGALLFLRKRLQGRETGKPEV
jgi:hypothetical protein